MTTSFHALCCLFLVLTGPPVILHQNEGRPAKNNGQTHELDAAEAFKPDITTSKDSCVRVSSGSAQVAIVKNNCNKPLQFTIHWSGNHQARDKAYRVGPNEDREIKMLDSTGSVTAEGDPDFGIGRKGDVSVVQKHTSVPNTDILAIENHHSTYGLVKVVLRLYFPNGHVSPSTHLVVIRPKSMGDVNLTFFLTDVFSKWDVQSLQAEDDPE